MFSLHGAQVAALLCTLADGSLLDLHAYQHSQVQPASIRTFRPENGHHHPVNNHRVYSVVQGLRAVQTPCFFYDSNSFYCYLCKPLELK